MILQYADDIIVTELINIAAFLHPAFNIVDG